MKNARLFTIAFCMLACTHSQSNVSACFKDSVKCNSLIKNVPLVPVVKTKEPVVNAAPDLPFFKDVLDSKRLFW